MFIQRSHMRLAEGWHRLMGWQGSYVRDLMGHHLVIFHGRTPRDPRWYKWVDGHFRGSAEKLCEAKLELEREAHGEGTAWSKSGARVTSAGNAANSTPLTVGLVSTGTSTRSTYASADDPALCIEGASFGGEPLDGASHARLEPNEGAENDQITGI